MKTKDKYALLWEILIEWWDCLDEELQKELNDVSKR